MLGVVLDLSPIGVYKGLWVTQALAEECLELVPRNRDKSLCVMSPLVLLPAEADPVSKEGRCKENLGKLCSSSDSKVVLTLLTEVIAIHMGLSAVYIRGASLQFLPGHLGDERSWEGSENGNGSSSLQNGLKNLLQVIFGVLGDTSSSGRGVSKRFCPWGSSGLVEQFVTWLWSWKKVKESNGGSDGESNRGTFPAGTSAASDWGLLRADIF